MNKPESFNAAQWLVDRHVASGGGRVAYYYLDHTITYDELQRQTFRAARLLAELGVRSGDRVLMVVRDEPEFPAVFIGAMRMGAVPVPVSTMLRADDVAALATDSQATAAVLSEPFIDYLPAITAAGPPDMATIVLGAGFHPQASSRPLTAWVSWTDERPTATAPTTTDSPGFWLYTSGTTGRPKGVVHRHGDIRAVAATYGRSVLDIGREDICYSVAKLFFAFGLGNTLLLPLSVGARAVLDPESPAPGRVAGVAADHQPTLFFAPPGFCAALADSDVPAESFASVRATITAGETLPAEVYRRFRARFGSEMLDGIGSTEALHIFCSNHPGDVQPGATGRPVDGYQLRILDEEGAEISEPDKPGALWVKGESVTTGYWERPDVNSATFVDGWCRTGDVYRRDANGYFYFVGRNSDMIKAGGIWVSPAEVESVLLEHPSVLEAAVVGGRNRDGLEITVAFVVASSGQAVDAETLTAHCRQRMASFKRPRQIHVIDALPKTATGKIQRFALRARLESERVGAQTTGA